MAGLGIYVHMLTGLMALFLSLMLAVAQWPLGRWALADGGDAKRYGFWVCTSSATLNGLALVYFGLTAPNAPIFLAGLAFGLAYGVGFCWLIMRALQIGPAAPTATINNMGFVGGVLLSCLYVRPHSPELITMIGLLGAVVGAALIALGSKSKSVSSAKKIPNEWILFLFGGWLFSCLSSSAGTFVGSRSAGQVSLTLYYSVIGFALGALLLYIHPEVRKPHSERERIGGMISGVSNGILNVLVVISLWSLNPEFVFPTLVAGQTVFVLFLGYLFYGEKLDRNSIAGSLLSCLSVVLMALGEAG